MSDAELVGYANDVRKELDRYAMQMYSLSSLMLGMENHEGRKAEKVAERIITSRAVNAITALSGKEPVLFHELYTTPIEVD